jgi:hypothetical protein
MATIPKTGKKTTTTVITGGWGREPKPVRDAADSKGGAK